MGAALFFVGCLAVNGRLGEASLPVNYKYER
jgi:hypothetical protein